MDPMVGVELGEIGNLVGREVLSGWIDVSQERIGQFAEATEDRQWIHVEPDRARKQSPYGTTIAHGFLTLSLVSRLMAQAIRVTGVRLAINYGLNRVRFPSAVPAGSRVRGRIVLQSVRDAAGACEAVWFVTVEREGSEKPCCVAEWVVRYYR